MTRRRMRLRACGIEPVRRGGFWSCRGHPPLPEEVPPGFHNSLGSGKLNGDGDRRFGCGSGGGVVHGSGWVLL